MNAGALVLAAGLAAIAATGCGARPAGKSPADSAATNVAPAPAAQATSPALDTARAAIVRHGLTALKLDCLAFERLDGTGAIIYDVRERHGGACGGDPAVSPRLFTIAVDTTTWIVSTDAGSPTAEMRPLPR